MSEKQILVNREYKDNVFRILFRDDKERQMELYHAVSGKKCMDAADLQVVTLKHAIYMGMKNALAFIVSDDLHLYEHQSSVNPNPDKPEPKFCQNAQYFVIKCLICRCGFYITYRKSMKAW